MTTPQTLKELEGEDILCLAAEPWAEDHTNSQINILRELASKNRILYLNLRSRGKARFFQLDDNIFIYEQGRPAQAKGGRKAGRLSHFFSTLGVRLLKMRLGFKPRLVWAASPEIYADALYYRKGKRLVYFCSQEQTEAPAAEYGGAEDALLKSADLCFFNSRAMFEAKKELNPKSVLLPEAIDYAHFSEAAKSGIKPFDIRDLPTPAVGYAGPLADLDFDEVHALAKANPAVSFIFLGDLDAELAAHDHGKNVYFLGRKAYEELPYYLRHFDVICLFYDAGGENAGARSPKRLLEFLATGKPVAASSWEGGEEWKEFLYTADNPDDLNEILREAIMEDDPETVRKRMKYAASFTWKRSAGLAGSYAFALLEGREIPFSGDAERKAPSHGRIGK